MITKKDKQILDFIEQRGSISINQCAQMFYPYRFGYDYARLKLKKLKGMELLKVTHDPILNEHLYYINKAPSPHNNAILNFYTNLIAFKLPVRIFEREKAFKDINIRADGFCVWEGQYGAQIAIIEVDLYHNTNILKYENNKDWFIEQYGDMPYLVILSLIPRNVQSQDITIINMDLKCSEFIEKVLSL
jgi:hypothetical protein